MTRFEFGRFALSLLLTASLCMVPMACNGGGDDDDDDDDPGESWLYQLQNLDPEAVAPTGFDWLVTDYAEYGDEQSEWSPADVAVMKSGERTVLAYISIGEAEDYRFYWGPDWESDPPDWLDEENPGWPGNYKVRFWYGEWQDIVFQYLDRILDAGFDGAYMDIIDAYEYWQNDGIDDADERMVDFVIDIADYTRKQEPGFLIFPQNGTDLVWLDDYLEAIDGVGAEDTWYDGDDRQPDQENKWVLENLDEVADNGGTVLAVDYCREPENIDDFYARARARGYIPYATVRDLDEMIINPGRQP